MLACIESTAAQIFMLLSSSERWSFSGHSFGPLPCIAFEAVIDFTIFYRAIAGLGIAIFRLIYINHTDLAGKDSPLKYLFTCGGVGLALVLTLAHILGCNSIDFGNLQKLVPRAS